jgi:hypothetical protein
MIERAVINVVQYMINNAGSCFAVRIRVLDFARLTG